MACLFSYQHKSSVGTSRQLPLRLTPYSVEWTYRLNTNVEDTYGGQVVQVLSVLIDQVTIIGKFGKEGPHGHVIARTNSGSILRERDKSDWYDYTVTNPNQPYLTGLTQMTEYFRDYFGLATQGGEGDAGSFMQTPMTFTYDGGSRVWQIMPVSFPSYKRSNDNFAPEWRVIGEVVEAPFQIQQTTQKEAVNRLQTLVEGVRYNAHNPFSDPLVSSDTAITMENSLISQFKSLLPKFTTGEIADMIWRDISLPALQGERPLDPTIAASANINDSSPGGRGGF